MTADPKAVDVLAAIRAGTNATSGWPGQAMNEVAVRLAKAEAAYLTLISAADAMSRVRLAKGNDCGREKQIRLRAAIAICRGAS